MNGESHFRELVNKSSCPERESEKLKMEKTQILDLVSEDGEIFKIEAQSKKTPRRRLLSCIDTQVGQKSKFDSDKL